MTILTTINIQCDTIFYITMMIYYWYTYICDYTTFIEHLQVFCSDAWHYDYDATHCHCWYWCSIIHTFHFTPTLSIHCDLFLEHCLMSDTYLPDDALCWPIDTFHLQVFDRPHTLYVFYRWLILYSESWYSDYYSVFLYCIILLPIFLWSIVLYLWYSLFYLFFDTWWWLFILLQYLCYLSMFYYSDYYLLCGNTVILMEVFWHTFYSHSYIIDWSEFFWYLMVYARFCCVTAALYAFAADIAFARISLYAALCTARRSRRAALPGVLPCRTSPLSPILPPFTCCGVCTFCHYAVLIRWIGWIYRFLRYSAVTTFAISGVFTPTPDLCGCYYYYRYTLP